MVTKNVVITGSTRGIGYAMAVELLKAGCKVTISGRGEKLNDLTRNTLDPFQERFIYIPCDVQSKEEAVQWAKRMPDPQGYGEGQIELRQVY